MTVEDVGEGATCTHDLEKPDVQVCLPEQDAESIPNFVEMHLQLRGRQLHMQLLDDLVEHMWTHTENQ